MKIKSTQGYGNNQLKILIYGPPGSGKTTLGGTCGSETCIISAEGGLLSLADKQVSFIDITTNDKGELLDKGARWARLLEAYEFLNMPEQRTKFKWIILDSISEMAQNLVEALQKKYPDKKDALNLWGEYASLMRTMIKSFRDIQEYNVVVLALSTSEKDDVGKRFFAVDMAGKISQQIPAYFDLCMHMYVGENEEKKEIRGLITRPNEKYVACKDRSGKLDVFEEPNLSKIAAKIHGNKKGVTV